jgi:hypothetical protein
MAILPSGYRFINIKFFWRNGENILSLEADALRFITDFGSFARETIKNYILVLEKTIKDYGCPKQMMTNHRTSFTSMPRESCKNQCLPGFLI